MANEFKIKKGLIVTGASGGTVVDIQGSQGQLFSVTDDLSGSIFAVSDISGVPIFDVNSSGLSTFDGNVNLPDSKKILLGTGNDFQLYHDGTHGVLNNTTGNLYTSALGSMMFRTSLNVTALTLDASQNATFEGTIDSGSITSTGTVSADTYFESTDASLVLGTTGAGTIFLRPNGIGSGTGAMSVSSSGTISTGGIIDMNSNKITELSPGTTNLDAVNYQQLQDAIAGVLVYQGTWNASTNTPTLTSGVGTPGYYYIVSVAGNTNLDGITDWLPGDWAIFSDLATDAWQKIDHTNVLNGAGTGQKVTKWDGSGTSYALTDGPITFSGNNSTFAGNVTATSGIFSDVATLETKLNGNDSALNFTTASGDTFRIGLKDSDDTFRIAKSDASLATNTYLTINSSGNSTFAGDATVNGTIASLNTNDFGTIRFGNNGNRYVRGNSAELQIGSVLNNIHFQSTGANRIDSGAADGTAAFRINARTSHTSGNLFEVTNANSIKLAIDYDGDTTFAGNVTASNFYGLAQDLAVTSNDTFNGTYSLLWHSGADVYSSTWMTVTGSNDTLTVPTIAADLNGTINTATTGTTQTAGNNSTLIATTAYADAAAAAVPIGNYLPLSAGSSYPLTGILYLGNVGSDQKIQFQRTGGNVYSIEHDSAKLYFYNRTTTEAPLVIQNDGDVLLNGGKRRDRDD